MADSVCWGKEELERLRAWEHSFPGRYALGMERSLLFRLMSGWPRRRQRLLEVGCGTGFFLEAAWESGFSVSGLDRSPLMLQATRERLGPRADLHLGAAEDLPFWDNDFDFVLVLTVLECVSNPQAVLAEACRVARKGVVVSFLNPFSVYYLTHGLPWPGVRNSLLRRAKWLSWPRLRCMILQEAGPRPMTCRSVLPGPMVSWRNNRVCNTLNARIYPPNIGAYQGVRIDLVGQPVGTPLLGWTHQPAA